MEGVVKTEQKEVRVGPTVSVRRASTVKHIFFSFFIFQGLEYFRAHSRDKRIPCLLSGQGY